MAKLVIKKPTDMRTGMSDIDSEVSLQQLIAINEGATHQLWEVSNGRAMAFDLSTNIDLENPFDPFTVSIDQIALFKDLSETPLFWRMTDVPLDALLDVTSATGNSIAFSIQIPDFWQATISATFTNIEDLETYNLTSFEDEFLGSYQSFVPYLLRGADNITGSAGADFLIGYAGNDVIRGMGGNDTLKGDKNNDRLYGGEGKDKLQGGPGNDKFVFDVAALGTNVDTILDFQPGADKIWLDKDIFKKFATVANGGNLPAAKFSDSGVAQDANDFIVYNQGTGKLYYDTNGSGDGGLKLIAILTTHPDLANTDIQFIA